MRIQSLIEALENGTIAAESGGNPNALHPLVKRGQYAGQRAIGLLGIMPGNVPGWSREHLGREWTPAELAQDTKEAQEAQKRIYRGEMQKHLARGASPQDAASIWFTGRPYAQAVKAGANDTFTNVQNYVAKVTGSAPAAAPGPTGPAAPTTGSQTMPMGGLGGLGGYQPPTGMQTFGDILQALGMSMLSSPNNNMFQGVPQMMTAIQGRRGKEAETARDTERWGMEFGLKKEDLEARRAEQAIDNARQERALKLQEATASRSGNSAAYNTTVAMFPDLKPGSPEFLEKYKEVSRAGGTDEVWGTTQTEGLNEKGEVVKYITSNKGNTKVVTPDGVKPMPRTTNVKTATENLTLDQSGNIIKREPLNVAQGESEKKQGQSLGERIAEAPGRLDRIGKSIGEVDAILNDPNKFWGTGIMSLGNNLPSYPGGAFEDRVKQAKAGAFAEGIQMLKGFGSLTEKEGDKAENAQTRMNTARSEKDFNKAAQDYRDALVEAQMKIKRFIAQNPGVAPPGAPAPSAAAPPGSSGGGRMRFDANGNPI